MSKLILIDEGDIRLLTFEEILNMYKPLIRKRAYAFDNLKIDFDDRCQLASIGLWHAYEKFDLSKNIGFGILAKRLIDNELKGVSLYENRQKRSGAVILSIEGTIEGRWKEISIMDILESDQDLEDDIVLRDSMRNFVSRLTSNQKETIELCSRVKSYKEVAKILGVAATTVSMRMTTAKKIFNECMIG